MSINEEMRSLAQGIIGSYETRVAGIASLHQATQTQLRDLNRAHQAMGRQLRADLSQAEARRKQAEARRKKEISNAHAEARGEWRKLGAAMRAQRSQPVTEVKPPEAVAYSRPTKSKKSKE